MSLTTLTIDGNDYIAYATVAEANIRLAIDPTRKAKWEALPDEDAKKRNLVAATFRLDVLPWKGKRAGGTTQENAWPRAELKYQDGSDVDDATIPSQIEQATILLAGSVSVDANHATIVTQRSIKRVNAEQAEVEFFGPSDTRAATNPEQISDPLVHELVKQWLIVTQTKGGTISSCGAESFGTSSETVFERQYKRTRGY